MKRNGRILRLRGSRRSQRWYRWSCARPLLVEYLEERTLLASDSSPKRCQETGCLRKLHCPRGSSRPDYDDSRTSHWRIGARWRRSSLKVLKRACLAIGLFLLLGLRAVSRSAIWRLGVGFVAQSRRIEAAIHALHIGRGNLATPPRSRFPIRTTRRSLAMGWRSVTMASTVSG